MFFYLSVCLKNEKAVYEYADYVSICCYVLHASSTAAILLQDCLYMWESGTNKNWQSLMYHRFVFRKLMLKIHQHNVWYSTELFWIVLFIPWLWTWQVCSDEVTHLMVRDIYSHSKLTLTVCALNHLYTAYMWSHFVLKCPMCLCCVVFK